MRYKLSYSICNYIYCIFNYINKELGKSDITYTLIETRLTRLTDEKTEIKKTIRKKRLSGLELTLSRNLRHLKTVLLSCF